MAVIEYVVMVYTVIMAEKLVKKTRLIHGQVGILRVTRKPSTNQN